MKPANITSAASAAKMLSLIMITPTLLCYERRIGRSNLTKKWSGKLSVLLNNRTQLRDEKHGLMGYLLQCRLMRLKINANIFASSIYRRVELMRALLPKGLRTLRMCAHASQARNQTR
jgi:hypothetical protein